MKKVFASILVVATAAAIMVSCTSTTKTMMETGLQPQKADYKILGEITGKGSATRIVWINFARLFAKDVGYTFYRSSHDFPFFFGIGGGSLLDYIPSAVADATEIAMYDAISKLDNADMMLEPKIDAEVTNLVIIQRAKVTLKAKAIQFTGPSAAK